MSGYSTKEEAISAARSVVDLIKRNPNDLYGQLKAIGDLNSELRVTVDPLSREIVEVFIPEGIGEDNAR